MISDVLADATVKMDKAVGVAKEDFSTVRTGRANPGLFQKVLVSYYGTPTPLSQLASLQNIEARTLLVTPYDKGALRDIEQAIRDMPNLGANPTNDGSVIRINLPELTAERRKEFVKIVRTKAEDAKIAVRNIRRSAKSDLDALKGDIGDDELSRGEKELEALTKQHVDAIDEALKRKESELLEV
ncbi:MULTISPECIES: ribosome recycling factor [Rathayibacter]|uniref:Ribosome-recycling factor n=2 Tax=Rathayibacter festucae TaxID=110937 RepID=A0A3Q9UVA8_9MICO|nr:MULTISPECIES: ribosome recycling factor [Rathayibacter]NQX14443.1 ribosome recycling factor [Rathayibacter sp. VKM Ac-2857]NRG39523.1 ribosome recycling factor [Rathayibacter sp. VKM Ac-2835]AZZ51451.1 ribosome recycling factor [Rathayibacter festucae DSM 15932]MCJ1673195.1 ribosome recycling factor [Rathayibacter sp. VKM Ac-2929]MCJ1682694.1 ribosome recycling factor [Rathayibacter sp. VKM Ac-2928]